MLKPNEVFILRRGDSGFIYPPLTVSNRGEQITFTAVNSGATVILPRSLYPEDIKVRRSESRPIIIDKEAADGFYLYSVQLDDTAEFAKAGSSPIIIIR
jgi:hypothetical protein